MVKIDIRQGTAEDAMLIAGLIKNMVCEMAQYGGHEVDNSPEIWTSFEEDVKTNCTHQEYLYLIASHGSPAPTTFGMVAANIELLDDIFVAKTRLHLRVIYTIPSMRRQGIARLLIEKALAWGQSMNAVEADLNVLTANPARQLYEHLGFQPHEISMVKKLNSAQ